MGSTLGNTFRGFGSEILDSIRQTAKEKISEAEFEERIVGIERATISMLEVGVSRDDIIRMLQKHWDLRLSEATSFVEHFKQ